MNEKRGITFSRIGIYRLNLLIQQNFDACALIKQLLSTIAYMYLH
jgi:hypothetical protein